MMAILAHDIFRYELLSPLEDGNSEGDAELHLPAVLEDIGLAMTVTDNQSPTESQVTDGRFIQVTDEETDEFLKENAHKNTLYKTKSDMKIFSDWMIENNEYRTLCDILSSDLDALLARFYLRTRKKDDTEYVHDTLTSNQDSIDRHVKDLKLNINIKTDADFSHSRRVLEAKRKNLKSIGKGNIPKKTEALTPEEIAILHEKSIIGAESSTKTRSGSKRGDYRRVTPKMFEQKDNPNCPVQVYKLYKSHRPTDLDAPDARFYLRPLVNKPGIHISL